MDMQYPKRKNVKCLCFTGPLAGLVVEPVMGKHLRLCESCMWDARARGDRITYFFTGFGTNIAA